MGGAQTYPPPPWPARRTGRRDAGRSTRALHLDMSGGYSAARARQDEYLASLVIRDARARADGVDKDGVLAYLHRPKTRERPNETFLANTLRGVRSANERDARRANDTERSPSGRGARRRDDRADASGEASPSSSSTTTSSSPSASSRDGDAELAAFLSRPGRARRGRGAWEAARTSPARTSLPLRRRPSSEPTGTPTSPRTRWRRSPPTPRARRETPLRSRSGPKISVRRETHEKNAKRRSGRRKERSGSARNGRDARVRKMRTRRRRLAVGCGVVSRVE